MIVNKVKNGIISKRNLSNKNDNILYRTCFASSVINIIFADDGHTLSAVRYEFIGGHDIASYYKGHIRFNMYNYISNSRIKHWYMMFSPDVLQSTLNRKCFFVKASVNKTLNKTLWHRMHVYLFMCTYTH